MGLKRILRYPLDVRRAERLLSEKPTGDRASLTERPVTLDLQTRQLLFDGARHLASLAAHAHAAGSPLWLRCDRRLLAEIAHKPYGRQMLVAPGVRWVGPADTLPVDTVVLSDGDAVENRHHVGSERVLKSRYHPLACGRVGRGSGRGGLPHATPQATGRPSEFQNSFSEPYWHLLVGRDIVPGSAVMPYPMHPNSLERISDELLRRLRRSRSRAGIFFAGNQKTRYDNASLEHDFGVISRPRMLRSLRQHFGERTFESFSAAEHARSDRAHGRSLGSPNRTDLILIDSKVAPITADDWLPTLAKANFFLCPPGASQPICHNLVEAMSVGAIPVLEYHDRLTPALEDSVNAVCFRGRPGLIRAIHRIDRMPQRQIDQMQRGAIDYYESHLRGDRFLANLRDGHRMPTSRQVSMPFHNRNFFDIASWPAAKRAA